MGHRKKPRFVAAITLALLTLAACSDSIEPDSSRVPSAPSSQVSAVEPPPPQAAPAPPPSSTEPSSEAPGETAIEEEPAPPEEPGPFETFADELCTTYRDEVVDELNRILDAHRNGTFEETPNHHPAYPSSFPPARNLPAIKSLEDVFVLWKEDVPISDTSWYVGGVEIVVPIDESHLYTLEPAKFSTDDITTTIGFGNSGYSAKGIEEFLAQSGEHPWNIMSGGMSDADSAEYDGLTTEEWEGLQAEKAEYETLSGEERAARGESGAVGCIKFIHLWWEETISIELIRHVGGEQFEAWLREQKEKDECSTIYSFADHFSMDLETLITLTRASIDTGHYPLETLKARYSYLSRNGENYIGDSLASSIRSDSNTNVDMAPPADISIQINQAPLASTAYSIDSTEDLWQLLPLEPSNTFVRGWPDIVFSSEYVDSVQVYDYSGVENYVRSDSIEPVPVPDLIFQESLERLPEGVYRYDVQHSSQSPGWQGKYDEVEERGYVFVVAVGSEVYAYPFRIYHDGSHN